MPDPARATAWSCDAAADQHVNSVWLTRSSSECRLTAKYGFEKPNDRRALDLMNEAAEAVMKDLPDLVLAYGQSDEFRYVCTTTLPGFRLPMLVLEVE